MDSTTVLDSIQKEIVARLSAAVRKSQLGFDFHLQGGTGSSHRGAKRRPGKQAVAPSMPVVAAKKPDSDMIFVRSPKNDGERSGGSARQHGFNTFPDKEGYEKVFAPYGPKGKGYYYKRQASVANVPQTGGKSADAASKQPWKMTREEYTTRGEFSSPAWVTEQYYPLNERVIAAERAYEGIKDRRVQQKDVKARNAELKAATTELADTKKKLRAFIHRTNDTHETWIEDALASGKPVSPEVLADYSDLAAKYASDKKPEAPENTKGKQNTPAGYSYQFLDFAQGRQVGIYRKGELIMVANWNNGEPRDIEFTDPSHQKTNRTRQAAIDTLKAAIREHEAKVQKSLVRGHYRDSGEKRVYIRPHVTCSHPRHKAVHTYARWSKAGKARAVRICSHCGHIERVRFSKSLGDWVLSKAVPLKSGQRWITVHPNGEDEKGVPVLIQENSDGSASIIRGAGGKLNYLRLTKLRKPEEWKQANKEAQEEKKKRREERQAALSEEEQRKEAEFTTSLKQGKDLRDAQFVQQVMEAHGVPQEQWQLPEKVLGAMPPKSAHLAEKQHLRKMVKVARELVDQARQDIVAAQDEVIKEAIGDLPGETILPPKPVTTGVGYVAAVSRKAEENGLTTQEAKREAADISWRHFLDAAEGNEGEALAKKENVERLHDALARVRTPVTQARKMGLLDVEIKPEQPAVEKIADVLVAERKHAEAEKQYQTVQQEVAERGLPKTAFVAAKELAEGAIPEMSDKDAKEALVRELQEDAMQRSASRILEQADEESGRGALREHLGVGHYDAINTAALGASQAPCPIDRVTADILGPAATAQLLVEHWRQQLSPDELDSVREGISSFHVKRQKDVADTASREYDDLKAQMDAVEIPKVTDAESVMNAQMANDKKAELLMQARRSLGLALGKLEGYAAIVQAFEEGEPKELRVSLGAIANKQSVAQARVMGLSPEDYQIDSDGINKFLTVNKDGMQKLVKGIDKEFAEKVKVAEEIKSGVQDEDNWLPKGFASRPATTFDDPHERALMVTEPISLKDGMSQGEVESTLEDYIGARLADGQDPESLRADLLSAEFVADSVPKSMLGQKSDGPYYEALRNLGFFSYKQVENATGEEFAKRAEAIVAKRRAKLGESANIAALNSQSIPLSETTYEAVHRAMAKVPHAQVIGKGIGELTAQDKGTLRDFFWKNMTDEKPPVASETKQKKAEAQARAEEVVAHQYDIFGNLQEVKRSPEEAPEEASKETSWDRYIRAMGGTDRAYAAIQDVARGQFMKQFAKQLGSITGTEFKTGTKRIANWDRHVLGLLSPERQAQLLGDRASAEKRQQAYAATRSGGKFAKEEAAGTRREKAEALMRAMKQSQMALFRGGNDPGVERVTLGERAEAQLAKVFPMVARNFDPKKPVEIPKNIKMSGKYVLQQRAVKLLEANKRIGLHLGVGSGKSPVALGAFSHLHSKGKVTRGIFAVPSVVCGQFGGEALRFFEPTKYRWFANPAATSEERRAAYADPDRHIVVVTHQALRDDLTKLMADEKFGGDVKKAANWFRTADEGERRTTLKGAMNKAGWKFDMSVVDEGHDLLNRRGKANSAMANAIDALTMEMPFHTSMTADPVKNDSSEAFSFLHKLDPDRYSNPDEFHQKYGVDTAASKVALQQEMSPYTITGRIRPEVTAQRVTREHDMLPDQHAQYREVLSNYRKARQATRAGGVDVDAVRALSPHAFEGLSEAQAREKAVQLSQFLSSTRDMALDRIVNTGHVDKNTKDAPCAKLNDVMSYIDSKKNPDGTRKPGLIFAHGRDSVKRLKAELSKKGLKVLTLTGEHSSADKEKAKLAFQGGQGDVLILSDAGKVGANLQRASWVAQYDTPDTAMTWEQRIGRMERIGQVNPDIEAADFVSKSPYEAGRRKRLKTKSELREIFTSPTEMLDDTGLAHEIWTARQRKLQRDILPQAAG